jgi:hypothetical protein
MEIELIYKPSKDNVVLDVFNYKEEYQGKMPWENNQSPLAMFVKRVIYKRERYERDMWEITSCKIILWTYTKKR